MSIENWLHGKKACAIFLFIFLTRLGWLGVYYYIDNKTSSPCMNITYENGEIADNMIKGQGFALTHRVFLPPGPTAHKPPMYPSLVFLTILVGGDSSLLLLRIIQCLLLSAGIFILIKLFARLFGSTTGILAGLLMIINPVLAKAGVFFENTSLAIFMFSLVTYTFFLTPPMASFRRAMLAGLLLGLASLTNPVLFVFLPIATLWVFFKRSQKVSWTFLFVIVTLITIFPWSLRNKLVIGDWALVSSNLPFEIWMGNNPLATGCFTQANGTGMPFPSHLIEKASRLNEIQGYKVFQTEAFSYIRENPWKFVTLRIKSYFFFWFTSRTWLHGALPSDFINIPIAFLMLLTAVGGLLLSFKQGYSDSLLWMMFFLGFSFVYGFTHADLVDRYRLPLDPFLTGFSAVFIHSCFLKNKQRFDSSLAIGLTFLKKLLR